MKWLGKEGNMACFKFFYGNRVHTGHGKPGKSWNLRISFSRPGKSWNLFIGPGKSMFCLVDYKNYIIVAADDILKARIIDI